MQAGCLIGEGSITEEMDALHIVIDACCLGRKKTGNESYVGGLLRGLESLPVRLVDIPSNSQARIYSLPMGGEARFTIVTTSAYAGERPKCFHWVNIPTGNFVTRNFVTIPRMLKWLRADLYHASYWTRFWALPCPSILVVHDMSFAAFPQSYRKHEQVVYETLVRFSARASKHLLTVSEFSKSEIKRYWKIPSEHITVTYNAIGAEFSPLCPERDSRARLGANGSSSGIEQETDRQTEQPCSSSVPFLLYVGTLHSRKNLLSLVLAFRILKSDYGLIHKLRIVGQASWLADPAFDAVRRYQLQGAVDFTGYVSQEELIMNYRRAELLIYPSLYEGFGLPLLEAMACGCPVVSSDSASLPEIAGGAAYLANASDPAALAEAIHEVVSNPILREDLRSTGLARAKQFTWEKCAEKTLVAYGKALISDNKS